MTTFIYSTLNINLIYDHKAAYVDFYAKQLFEYAELIEFVKLLHAISLVLVFSIIFYYVRLNKLLSSLEYTRILLLTVWITVLYMFVSIAITKYTYEKSVKQG